MSRKDEQRRARVDRAVADPDGYLTATEALVDQVAVTTGRERTKASVEAFHRLQAFRDAIVDGQVRRGPFSARYRSIVDRLEPMLFDTPPSPQANIIEKVMAEVRNELDQTFANNADATYEDAIADIERRFHTALNPEF